MEMKEHIFILQTIRECNDSGKAVGRQMISDKSSGIPLTNQQIRLYLENMKEKGLVHVGKGKPPK
jgi:hypothetical protein